MFITRCSTYSTAQNYGTKNFARSKTLSLPIVIATNSPQWDKNRNHIKDESNRKPQ